LQQSKRITPAEIQCIVDFGFAIFVEFEDQLAVP
jgi:hypothetical protein